MLPNKFKTMKAAGLNPAAFCFLYDFEMIDSFRIVQKILLRLVR